jgi:hypothetical protein
MKPRKEESMIRREQSVQHTLHAGCVGCITTKWSNVLDVIRILKNNFFIEYFGIIWNVCNILEIFL